MRWGPRDQRGVALLLSLLVLVAVLTATLTAASLVSRQYRLTATSDRGVVAFYAAEAGLEQGLYLLRQEGNGLTWQDQKQLIDHGDQGNPEVLQSNGAGWWRSSTFSQDLLQVTLPKDQTIQLQLFDPAASTQAQSISLSWDSRVEVCPQAGFEWLELVQSGLDSNSLASVSERRYLSASDASGATQNLAASFPVVRLRALYADICGLSVQAYAGPDRSGGTYKIPSRVTVTTTAGLGGTLQSLSFTVPASVPQAGAFDYAIFSEATICKGFAVSEPCS